MGPQIDHIAMAVRDLDAVLRIYENIFNIEPTALMELDHQKIRMAIVQFGHVQVHFVTTTERGAGYIGKFLETHGEGIHHVGLQVEDVEATIVKFEESRLPVKNKTPMEAPGGIRMVYNDPKYTHHVLYELFDMQGQLKTGLT